MADASVELDHMLVLIWLGLYSNKPPPLYMSVDPTACCPVFEAEGCCCADAFCGCRY